MLHCCVKLKLCANIYMIKNMSKKHYFKMRKMLKERKRCFVKKAVIFHLNQWCLYYLFVIWIKYLFFTEVLYLGEQKKEKLDKPVIIVANHISEWDSFLVLSSLKRQFLLKHFVWRIPAHENQFKSLHKRMFFKLVGVYSIVGKGCLEKSLERTFSLLDSGHSTIFFPEGKRVPPKEISKPKKGIGHIIKNRDVYILPVHINYAQKNKEQFGAKIGDKARVVFGGVYSSEYFKKRYSEEDLHLGVMKKVLDLKGALQVGIKKEKLSPKISLSPAIKKISLTVE